MRAVDNWRKVDIETSEGSVQADSKCYRIMRSVNVQTIDEMNDVTVEYIKNL